MVEKALKMHPTLASEPMDEYSPIAAIRLVKSIEESIKSDDLEQFICRYVSNEVDVLRKYLRPSIIYGADKIFEWILKNLKYKKVIAMGRTRIKCVDEI